MTGLDRQQALAALMALGAAFPSCTSAPCTQTSATPSSSVECPSGTLCYQGSCVPACSAGAEERCTTSSDCKNELRPNCFRGSCTSCDEGQVCVPDLNVCSSIF